MELARPGQSDLDGFAHAGGTVGQHDQPVGEKYGFVQLGRDEQVGAAGLLEQLQEELLHELARHGVQAAKRFVHDHHHRIVDHGARQLGTPLHAAGQLDRVFVLELTQPDFVEQAVDFRIQLGTLHVAAELGPERHVLVGRQPGQQRRFLKHHHAVMGRAGDARAVEQNLTAVDAVEARHQIDQRGLTAPGGPDYGGQLAGGDRQAQARQHLLTFPGFAVTFVDAAQFDLALTGPGRGLRISSCSSGHAHRQNSLRHGMQTVPR